MKRFINILMAVFIAFLACYPCNDSDVCVDEKKKGSTEQAVANHEHSSNEVDLCSPFCFCSCCSSTINQPNFYSFIFFLPKMKVINSQLRPVSVKSIPHSIWQPPRLA